MLGFRNKDAAVMTEEFSKTAEAVYVASDDGSIGHKGFVTDMLKSMIDSGTRDFKDLYLRPQAYDENCGRPGGGEGYRVLCLHGGANGLRRRRLRNLHLHHEGRLKKAGLQGRPCV